ncbi:unnamed protein product [Anisakis simplex]|uniref:Uncharacterized protein n=1 Tax=Anisakis simplex TaxID=6269 RepID=A0A0M3JIS8_ANISI|nr:unnamed protein product [Anisakis simplex]
MRYRGDDRKEPTNAYNASLSSTIPPRRIPSLIDGIREGRIVDPLKGAAAGAPVGSSRIVDPTKDLGPQVIYPSARPTSAGGNCCRIDIPLSLLRTFHLYDSSFVVICDKYCSPFM